MGFELGGFAFNDRDIDGTEKDREYFNVGVAESYIDAFYREDNEEIGGIDLAFLETIAHFYNLYGDREKDSENLLSGEFMTIKNRTFIDAIIDNKWVDYITLYLNCANYNYKGYRFEDLAVCFLLNSDKYTIDFGFNEALSKFILPKEEQREAYINRITTIVSKLEEEYKKENSIEKKIAMLKQLKQSLSRLRYPSYIGKIDMQDIDSNNFLKEKVFKRDCV